MKKITPEQKLEQLARLEKWIEKYLQEHPRNSGEYGFIPERLIDKPQRDGIVFYSGGWGWRLRKNWKEVLEQKKSDLQSQIQPKD